MKPINCNTEQVRLLLNKNPTVLRLPIKLKYCNTHLEMRTDKYGTRLIEIQNEEPGVTVIHNPNGTTTHRLLAAEDRSSPYRPGDILYVREAWCENENPNSPNFGGYEYRADYDAARDLIKWHPPIYMPKQAARIFLRVLCVREERLQDITEEQAEKEGCSSGCYMITGGPWGVEDDPEIWTAREEFSDLWNDSIKKADLSRYGWAANPWVQVIEYEQISKAVALEGGQHEICGGGTE